MADICPVCNKKAIGSSRAKIGELVIHASCIQAFRKDPEKYGGQAAIETAEKKVEEEYVGPQQEIEEKSVHVKSFDMPFGDMVGFMVKWALASIPAFIILAIIGAIFFAIFTAIFVSTR